MLSLMLLSHFKDVNSSWVQKTGKTVYEISASKRQAKPLSNKGKLIELPPILGNDIAFCISGSTQYFFGINSSTVFTKSIADKQWVPIKLTGIIKNYLVHDGLLYVTTSQDISKKLTSYSEKVKIIAIKGKIIKISCDSISYLSKGVRPIFSDKLGAASISRDGRKLYHLHLPDSIKLATPIATSRKTIMFKNSKNELFYWTPGTPLLKSKIKFINLNLSSATGDYIWTIGDTHEGTATEVFSNGKIQMKKLETKGKPILHIISDYNRSVVTIRNPGTKETEYYWFEKSESSMKYGIDTINNIVSTSQIQLLGKTLYYVDSNQMIRSNLIGN